MTTFGIRDLMKWITLAAIFIGLVHAFGMLGGLYGCMFVVTAYFVSDRLLYGAERNTRANTLALLGAVTGGVIGGVLGPLAGLGRVVLRLRPDLPEQDFGVPFGAIAGVFVGAVVGAILLSIKLLIRWGND